MKPFIILFIILIAASAYMFKDYAQCSDAGVCSVGGHSMEQESRSPFIISASYKFGLSGKDDDVKYHLFQLGTVYNVLESTSLQLSIPYNIQSGPLGEINGIGDLLISITQKLLSEEKSSLNVSIGAKLATGDDSKNNLPMAYQSGLGSNDFIFAINYSYESIGIGLGYQLAGSRNNNLIKLKRGDDLLIRATYIILLDKFTINPQLLFIKRLAKSNTVNNLSMAPIETFVDVANSDQTQFNLLTQVQYQINSNYSLIADFAVPFIKREVNVDGLTRAFSASAGVMISIN